MSVSSLTTLIVKLSNNNEELEDVGHFTALNLNYDSTNYEAKKFALQIFVVYSIRNAEQLIKELTIELQGYEDMFREENVEGGSSSKSEIDLKKRLLVKIKQASKILTDDEVKNRLYTLFYFPAEKCLFT